MIDKISPIPLLAGDKITLYSISDGAMTVKTEATVSTMFDEPQFREGYSNQARTTRGKWLYGTMRPKGKRQDHYLMITPDSSLVVPGWNHLPRDCDVYNKFTISACLNLAGTVDEVKALVDKNINPHFAAHDRVVAVPEAGKEILVYPDSPTDSANVESMRRKALA